ncbi:MAG: tetratricopeptide repeat protein [Deltaproteobacteria bacterium]|nr:tetratricopeptide repeat protein [Deltaproteobacteria bacterium]
MNRKPNTHIDLRPGIRYWKAAFMCVAFSALNICCGGDKNPSYAADQPDATLPKGPTEYQNLTKQAYKLKKDGHNAEALKIMQEAIKLTEPQSIIYASALDDQASIMLRMGQTDEAEKRYVESIQILKQKNATSALLNGVEERLDLLKRMKSKGITCNEPGSPVPDDKRPYYPNVPEYQQILGQLTRRVATCLDSNTIEAMMTRLMITGDGRLIHAWAKEKFAGTDTEKCVVKKLEELFPTLTLPPFGACFRGFTYPYMLGNHPDKKDSNTEAGAAIDSQIPIENATKGSMPSKVTAIKGATRLLDAYMNDNAETAMSFFFPGDAFNVVKDSPSPSRYYKKLLQWYREDFDLEKGRFQEGGWKLDDVSLGSCKWKAPGSEANKVGYWSCIRNTVSVSNGQQKRRFEIQVLINWGKDWYITHLRPVRQP